MKLTTRYQMLKEKTLSGWRGLKENWLKFAEGAKQIREEQVYLEEYETWAQFCESEFAQSKRRINQLISSSDVMQNIGGNHGSHLPNSERQARPLAKLEPELQRETWAEVIEENEPEKITAKIVSAKVEEKKELNEALKEVKRDNQPDTIFVEKPLTEKEIMQKAKELKEQRKEAYKAKLQAKIEEKAKQPLSDEEQEILTRAQNGETVVINMNKHFAVLKWAKENQKYQQIDRYSEWGNPFHLDTDGTRDEVCEAYEKHYLPHKKSLMNKIGSLKGCVLGCHCAPLRCHGHGIANTIKKLDNE